jgi:hypothetical protein
MAAALPTAGSDEYATEVKRLLKAVSKGAIDGVKAGLDAGIPVSHKNKVR